MAHLEGAYEQLDKRLGDLAATIDARFGQVDSRFAQIDARFAQIDSRCAEIERKIDTGQWRTYALVVGTWITTIGTVIFHHQ